MTSPVTVTDTDRKAASDYLRATSFDQKSERFHAEMLAGDRDASLTVKAFAHHAAQARLAALDEAAEVARANDGWNGLTIARLILKLKETPDAK